MIAAMTRRWPLEAQLAAAAGLLAAAYAVWVVAVSSTASFYVLDDPFIHFALAENIVRGHFGVNLDEASNPSSSILWPWLLAGFEPLGLLVVAPLFINIASFCATVGVLSGFVLRTLSPEGEHRLQALLVAGAGAFAFNLFGVVFTGMEHSLHVLLCVVATIRVIEKRYDRVALAALVLCPLMRFEGALVLAFGVGGALFDRRFRFALTALGLAVAGLCVYEAWLGFLGLPPLPSSVLSKSGVSADLLDGRHGSWRAAVETASHNLRMEAGRMFALTGIGLIGALSVARGRDRMIAAGMVILALLAFVAGRFDSFARYNVYVFCVLLVAMIHLTRVQLRLALSNPWLALVIAFALVGLNAEAGLSTFRDAPLAARNIDRQQRQMHRFIADCWRQPIAVNDLGWTSFRNDAYVLDLAGLGSEAARKARGAGGVSWMKSLADQRGVRAAAIYPQWFDGVPSQWTRVGDLVLLDPRITPAESRVAFFATRPDAVADVRACLTWLATRVPPGAAVDLRPSV